MISVIDDAATYLPGLGFLSGKKCKKTSGSSARLSRYATCIRKVMCFLIENYTHRYPACWRCKTELVWKVADEWYIAMDMGSMERVKHYASK